MMCSLQWGIVSAYFILMQPDFSLIDSLEHNILGL
jgi:hypothetical protein